jgi:general stress protein 26
MTQPEAIQKLGKLIKDIKFAMLTTENEDGVLHSRPMATQQVDFDGDLWFFTGRSTTKISEVDSHRHVNVSYAQPDDNRWVSVSGTAETVHDKAKMKELWNPLYKAWFPQGLEDPDVCLLRIRVESAEYWDTPSSKMVQLAGFIKAVATGKRFHPGENRELEIKPKDSAA